MKKFAIKLLIYVACLSAITVAVNLLYLHLSAKYIVSVPDHIQICNFGSSHGKRGFDYEDFKGKYSCSNFALTSQTLAYDMRILQHYKDRIDPGASVFIVASYFTFFGKPTTESKSFLSLNIRYYNLLPPELIMNYDWMTDISVHYLPVLSAATLTDFIKLLLGFSKKSTYESFNVVDEDLTRTTNPQAASDDAVLAYTRHISRQFDENGRRMRKQEAFDAVYEMIKLCREIGAKPILVTVPYTREYTDTIKKNAPESFREFYAVIDEIRQKTGIEYYDYGFDERFRNDYSLFLNSDHMNRKGARMFTRILLREVLGITPD